MSSKQPYCLSGCNVEAEMSGRRFLFPSADPVTKMAGVRRGGVSVGAPPSPSQLGLEFPAISISAPFGATMQVPDQRMRCLSLFLPGMCPGVYVPIEDSRNKVYCFLPSCSFDLVLRKYRCLICTVSAIISQWVGSFLAIKRGGRES